MAGVIQLVIVLASLGVPRILNWKQDFQNVSPLNRHIFWTYAAYILGTNLALGAVSLFGAGMLVKAEPLSVGVCGYIAVYWGARFLIQIFGYKGGDIPQGWHFVLADWLFRGAFLYLGAVFFIATYMGIKALS